MAVEHLPTHALLAVAAGIASHVFYFRIGEHHMYGVRYAQALLATCIGSTIYLTNAVGYSLPSAARTVGALAVCWLVGVYSSLIVYRLFLHPLRKFPGPFGARFGMLWFTTQLGKLDGYYQIHEFHKKYGKRRVWAPAFSDKALREYEPTVQEFNDKLVSRIGENQGKPMNMADWFALYGFDVMGRLAFGKDYHMLDNGKRHWAIDLMTEGMLLSGFRIPTWMFRVLLDIPGLAAGYHKFLKFCADEVKWRVENAEKSGKDITGWLLKAYTNEKHPEADPMLQGDARLIIVAGSDTTSATLTYLFYELAKDPNQVEKLREELKPLVHEAWTDKDIANAPHLNGAINETLRLHPPVPSGIYRRTPPEGTHVGDVYIPGDTTLFTPQFAMGRDEDIYAAADSFVPERWYSKPEMIKHPDAFAPFSMGPFNCIGRNLARMELRTLTAQLLLKYDVKFADGEDGTRLLTKTKDHFTLTVGQLDLVFTPATS
ncbi:Cytochrome P450 monooxygenase [Pseudocercospora fuligena]|uniref:Cytochrome P450 monooxygenase n=1 Tax=Pseudocercospora fuligena TaxID=685502 RepID=A0A8H6VT58_9PEZI|nr:Cytochrome P450 monooxygenase [Pseudocercospora fuligena]